MTDRYRYLPCALHEALKRPQWLSSTMGPSGPFVLFLEWDGARIDLAHPAGWDHAVRAYASIRGVVLLESASSSFVVEVAENAGQMVFVYSAWTELASIGACVPGMRPAPREWPHVQPADRREALCRCICAALNLRVEEVFP